MGLPWKTMLATVVSLFCLLGIVSGQPTPADKVLFASGPAGSWVSNGSWTLRLRQSREISSLADYRGLRWREDPGEAHFQQVQKIVFGRGKKVVLLDIEFCHPGKGAKPLGRAIPNWRLRSSDASQVGLGDSHLNQALDALESGLPKRVEVPAGKALRFSLLFFLPQVSRPTDLFFTSLRHSHDGESESLVIKLKKPAARAQVPLVAMPAPARGAGSAANPHQGRGPAGHWVSNQHWCLRLSGRSTIETIEAYRQLPWNQRTSPDKLEEHLNYVQSRVFQKGQQVLLLQIQARNLNTKKLGLGQSQPSWKLVTDQKRPLGVALHHQALAMWSLPGGMPREDLVNPKATSAGILVFFLPSTWQPRYLTFSSMRHSPHGETDSLQLQL